MTDNITLPRAVVEQVREALKELDYASEPYVNAIARAIRTELDAALAEPEKERAEVAAPARNGVASSMEEIDILTPESYRTTEPPAKPEPVAYLYHDAQTAQDAHPLMHSTMLVLATDRRPEYRNETPLYTAPLAKPEPATDATDNRRVWDAYIEACREFERFHGITKGGKT